METAGSVLGSAVGGITVAVAAGAQAESKTHMNINTETSNLRAFTLRAFTLRVFIFFSLDEYLIETNILQQSKFNIE